MLLCDTWCPVPVLLFFLFLSSQKQRAERDQRNVLLSHDSKLFLLILYLMVDNDVGGD